jgi:DNA invertase Pin-like site-specific DNA recombinase
MTKYVAYYRVSTAEQGNSGLGIEGQKTAVTLFTKGCTDCIIGHFKDIASGKDNTRVELLKAIDFAKKNDATLLIAKLDRLSRNAAFIFTLRDTKVNFVCCDMPDANTLTIGIFATLAQHERELISSRTKAALNEKKKKGDKLGNPNGFMGQDKATETKKSKAVQNANSDKTLIIKNRIKEVIELAGFKKENLSLSIIANKLNESNHTTTTNKTFSPQNVVPLLKVVLKELGLISLPKFESK